MSSIPTHVVLNPLAAAGRGARVQSDVLDALSREIGTPESLCIVRGPDDAEHSTRGALADGIARVIAVGGDGTMQRTIRGFFHRGRAVNPDAGLGIVSMGTGGDLARNLRVGRTLGEQLRTIAHGATRTIDLLEISGISAGAERRDLCANECQMGAGGTVTRRVRGALKRLGGPLAFGIATVLTALQEPGSIFEISYDGCATETLSLLGIVVANGEHMGGGMRFVPGADPADGLLSVLCIHAMPRL